jgi:hypothetical protein
LIANLFQLDERLGLSRQFADLKIGSGYRIRKNLQDIRLSKTRLPKLPILRVITSQLFPNRNLPPVPSDKTPTIAKRGRKRYLGNSTGSKRQTDIMLRSSKFAISLNLKKFYC